MRLRAERLRRRFGHHVAVDGLDLEVNPGEVVGLLGPNGAGKTTSFRMLAGLLRPDEGCVSLDGEDVTAWPLWRRARRGLGYLPQEPSLFRRLTVAQNVEVALQAARRPEPAHALLEAFGLGPLADRLGARLSGGERRRAELVRCLAAGPRLLLFDEPFSGLDPLASQQIAGHLRSLATAGLGVLLTDHDVRQTLDVCDRLYIVAAGIVLRHGSPAEVAADDRARALYLGSAVSPPVHRD